MTFQSKRKIEYMYTQGKRSRIHLKWKLPVRGSIEFLLGFPKNFDRVVGIYIYGVYPILTESDG